MKYGLNGWPVICQVSLVRFEKSVLANRSLTKLMPCHSSRFETGLNSWLFGKIVINIQVVNKKKYKINNIKSKMCVRCDKILYNFAAN